MRDAFRKSALAYRRSARSFVTCAAFRGLVFAVPVPFCTASRAGGLSRPFLHAQKSRAVSREIGYWIGMNG